MPRIPGVVERDGLSAEQLKIFDAIASSRGSVRGPYAILLRRPEIAGPAQEMGGYLRFRSAFDPGVRECTTMAVAALLDCDYEFQAHRKVALAAGVDPVVVETIAAKRFDGLAGDIGLAAVFARSLINEHRVPSELFERARTRWGDMGMIDLAAMVGYYAFLAAVINALEVEAV